LLRNARESELSIVPASIQSLVLARMDRLGAPDKAALQAASVIGKRFAIDTLRYLIDDPGYGGDGLFSADLVRPEGDDYVFAHALIQEGVYSSLLTGKRRDLHRKAAQWYTQREPILHAEHLDRAQDPEAANAYLAAAADQAGHCRFDSALRLAERGIELAASNEAHCGLLLLRGELLLGFGRSLESTAAYRTALELAADDAQRCEAWMGIAAADRVTGDIPAAMHALDQAESFAVRLGLAVERSKIHHTRGNLYFVLGNGKACNEQHEAALEIARRCGDAECEARALSGLGDGQYVKGRMLSALEYFRHCVEISRREGLVRVEIPNRCMEGHCLWHANQIDRAVAEARAACESAQAVGLLQGEIFAQESLSLFLVEAGRYEEGEQACIRGLSLARSAGARRYESAILYALATIRIAQGDKDAARDHLLQAMDLTRQSGPGFLEAAVYGRLSLIARQPAERKQALMEGETSLRQNCISHCYVWFYRDAIDATLMAGDWSEALRYVEALEEFIRPEPLPWSRLIIARGRALAHLGARGRDQDILAELRTVRTELERAGLRPAMAAVEAALNMP
jgi:tetratricopeptide (TPR) repeat protein